MPRYRVTSNCFTKFVYGQGQISEFRYVAEKMKVYTSNSGPRIWSS